MRRLRRNASVLPISQTAIPPTTQHHRDLLTGPAVEEIVRDIEHMQLLKLPDLLRNLAW